jgi:hypothetical protein
VWVLGGCRANAWEVTPWSAARGALMSYLLNTDVISELRNPKPHGGVIRWV